MHLRCRQQLTMTLIDAPLHSCFRMRTCPPESVPKPYCLPLRPHFATIAARRALNTILHFAVAFIVRSAHVTFFAIMKGCESHIRMLFAYISWSPTSSYNNYPIKSICCFRPFCGSLMVSVGKRSRAHVDRHVYVGNLGHIRIVRGRKNGASQGPVYADGFLLF